MQIWHSVHRERLIFIIIFTVKEISWKRHSYLIYGELV